jgi:hypothetical protein
MKPAIKLLHIPLLGAALCLPFAAKAQHINVGIGFRIGPPPPVRVWAPPPPPMQEMIYAAPGPGYVWVGGHYSWMNGQWVWIRGQWLVPPQPGSYWVAGGWDPNRNWIEGHWEIAQAAPPPPPPQYAPEYAPGPEVVVGEAPPPPIAEVVTVQPSPYHVWIRGYWGWDGHRRYWSAGHWELPPHGRHAWMEPRWEHRDGRYVFVHGYWR